MEESTPKEVHPRNLICRLCCEAFESRHLTRVFGRASKKEGSKEDLSWKIRNVCGIEITESDSLSTLICRKCDGFLSKASDFRQGVCKCKYSWKNIVQWSVVLSSPHGVSRLQSAQPPSSVVSRKAPPSNSTSERLQLKPYNENPWKRLIHRFCL